MPGRQHRLGVHGEKKGLSSLHKKANKHSNDENKSYFGQPKTNTSIYPIKHRNSYSSNKT
jgi:hypothetical protein